MTEGLGEKIGRTCRGAALTTAAAVVFLVSGCGEPAPIPVLKPTPTPPPTAAPTTPPPFPPRPATLDLAKVNPCHLLTATQQAELGIEQVGYSPDSDGQGSAACRWDDTRRGPDMSWLIRAVTAYGAQTAPPNNAQAEVTRIGGYGAVETTGPVGDPNRGCVLLIDAAPGQALGVQFEDRAGDLPGDSHKAACRQAAKVADMAIANLRK